MSERIGIVLVHGVGEQRRFEHLSGEALQIIRSLQDNPDIAGVSVQPRSSQDAEFAATNEFWLAEGGAPLRIDLLHRQAPGREPMAQSLFIHEVWWADLDNKNTLWERVKFWFWTFGRWAYIPFHTSGLPGFQKMKPPAFPAGGNPHRDSIVRLRLWVLGVVFLMAMLSLVPLGYLLRRLGLKMVGPEIFYQYLGDVKLYQDFRRKGQGNLTDVGHPPRVPIRRRMVRALVDAYFQDYDRWYVLAHSLGTVLAWNGLMETAHSLPNYLDEKTWNECLRIGLGKTVAGQGPVDEMRPSRPLWVKDPDHVIDRRMLFSKLRGFLTYGSPLDKFAYLWSAIVPINPDTAFRSDFEWINVFDHTDPVAAELTAYAAATPAPANYAYKASPVLLLSHIRYLNFRKDRPACLVNRLTDWMLRGSAFSAPVGSDPVWDSDTGFAKGFALRSIWWGIVSIILALFLGWAASLQFGGYLIGNAVLVFVAAAIVVTITGIVRHRYECHLGSGLPPPDRKK